MDCLDLEQIEEFASDGLDPGRRRAIEDHVSSCADCRNRVDEVRENLRVAERLAAAESGGHETVAVGAGAASPPNSNAVVPSSRFPGYQIVREVSRGGQGVVYQAIQRSTRRKVALKVLREGHFADTGERARFEREVQVLGQLKHPNIVAIHDSGTSDGHPFLVMDYISGRQLDEHVQETRGKGTNGRGTRSKGSIKGILELFATICEAVHAAHVKGIIHRDLKPSNIRVDENGEPLILDFGLAKIAGAAELTQSPAMTMTGMFIGSLPWSSPEQAEGVPSKIDIRTDVYSLGVILYQLLTGRFPYDVAGNHRDVIDRVIGAEPVRPRSIEPAIDDELETIVLKCLSKERDRRYQTAGEIARDLRRYLAGEPIEAKRDSGLYLLRKALLRYRAPVAAVAAFVVLLIVGLCVSLTLWNRALAAEKVARQQTTVAEKQSQETIEALAETERQRAIAIGNKNRAEDQERIAKESEQRAEEQKRLAVNNEKDAKTNLKKAEKRRAEFSDIADCLAVLLREKGSFVDAEWQFKKSLKEAREKVDRDTEDESHVATCMQNLAGVLRTKGEFEEAEQLYQDALDIRMRMARPGDPIISVACSELASLYYDEGHYKESEALFRSALKNLRDDGNVRSVRVRLAKTLIARGDFASAQHELDDVYRTMLDDPHPRLNFDQRVFATFAELYEAWDAREGGKGYDARAAEWCAKLKQPPK